MPVLLNVTWLHVLMLSDVGLDVGLDKLKQAGVRHQWLVHFPRTVAMLCAKRKWS